MLLSKSRNLENFKIRRGKRHRIDLALICIRLNRLHIGEGSHYVHILLTVFQSLRFGMGQKSPLPFLCVYRPVSGAAGERANDRAMEKFQYEQPESYCIEFKVENTILNTSPGAGGSEGVGGGVDD